MAFSITDLKKGTIFRLENVPYKVVDYSQKVMGRGGSIVTVKIKSLIDSKVLDKTFKGNERIEPAEVNNKTVQYLYKDESRHYFMDDQTFEQLEVDNGLIGEQTGYIKEGDKITAQFFQGKIINIELPKNIYLKVSYTEDAVKGDTTSSIMKDAKLETGITVRVPAFIKNEDVISIDTSTGTYRERKKD